MKSVYYDPETLQVQAELISPNFAPVRTWEAKGYIQALVPEGVSLTRDHLVELDARGVVVGSTPNKNPHQPQRPLSPSDAARKSGLAKIYTQAGLTQAEIDAQG